MGQHGLVEGDVAGHHIEDVGQSVPVIVWGAEGSLGARCSDALEGGAGATVATSSSAFWASRRAASRRA
jgi:hypothetical protein